MFTTSDGVDLLVEVLDLGEEGKISGDGSRGGGFVKVHLIKILRVI